MGRGGRALAALVQRVASLDLGLHLFHRCVPPPAAGPAFARAAPLRALAARHELGAALAAAATRAVGGGRRAAPALLWRRQEALHRLRAELRLAAVHDAAHLRGALRVAAARAVLVYEAAERGAAGVAERGLRAPEAALKRGRVARHARVVRERVPREAARVRVRLALAGRVRD